MGRVVGLHFPRRGRGLVILVTGLIGLLAQSGRLCRTSSSSSSSSSSVAGTKGASVEQSRAEGREVSGSLAQQAASHPLQDAPRPADVIEASGTMELAGLEDRFQAVARSVAPCVVAISACDTAVEASDSLQSQDMNGEKLASILERTTRTVGTGFFIDPDGYILTNEHVIGIAEQLWVTTDDRKVYPAVVIGSDPRADLAVLKIPGRNFTAARFAQPIDAVHRGQWTIVLGNPYGLAGEGEMAMSVGIVSAIDRSLPKLSSKENRLYSNLIQTTAEINPGNSGGPLFDLSGNVIGISTAVILPQKKTNGIGFAIPITRSLLSEVRELREGREIVYGYVGVIVGTPSPRERRMAGIDDDQSGVRIESVEPDAPAAASLKPKDIVIRINDEPVRDSDQFVRLIGACPAGKAASFEICRDSKIQTVDVTPRKRNLPSVAVTRETQRLRWQGMLLGPIPSHWSAGDAGQPKSGLMVLSIDATSPAKQYGVQQGTLITAVAGKSVASIADLQGILSDTPVEQCKLDLANAQSQVVSIEH